MFIYFKKQVQIKAKAQVLILLFDITSIIILVKYFDYSNIFSIENIAKLLEYIEINNYIIKLEKSK